MTCNLKYHRPQRRTIYAPHFGNIVNELFNTAMGDVVSKNENKQFTNPATNVKSYDDRFILEIALPGYSKDNVIIEVEDKLLKIQSKDLSEDADQNYRLREFDYSGFNKTYKLPEIVDIQGIEATFNFGVLNLVLNKKKEAIPQPPKKITIS